MPPPLVGLLMLIGLLAIWYFELVVPLGATTHIRICGDSLRVLRGSVRSHVQTALTDILRSAGVTRGFICVTDKRRIVFSRNIPAEIRQQIRNLLASQ